MSSYFKAVSEELKDWKKAIVVVIFTVARLIYGFEWIKAGWEKLPWLTDGKENSAALIGGMIKNITHSHGSDPLHLNGLITWAAQNIFLGMPNVTDALVVVFEIGVGLFILLGLQVVWAAVVAMFMNVQYITAGSANNFGYIWTNVVILKFGKFFDVIGIDGFLRFKKGKKLL